MSANHPQMAPKSPRICAHWPPIAPNQKQTISWATWLKMRFRAHLIHPQPPTFGGFHPSKLPQRTPRPPYLGPVGCGNRKVGRGGVSASHAAATGLAVWMQRAECETPAPFPTEDQWVSRDGSMPLTGGARGGWGAIWVRGLLLPQPKGRVVGLGSGYGLGARPWGVRARVVS